jgi:translocation and assembly module TamB
MSRLPHFAIHLLKSLIFLLLLFTAVIALISTDYGLNWTLQLAKKFMPGELQVTQLHGNLRKEITIQSLHYHNSNMDLTLDYFKLAWQPLALLQGRILVNDLQINDLTWRDLQPNTHKNWEWPDLKWLHHLTVQNIQLHNIFMQPENIKINVDGDSSHLDAIITTTQLQFTNYKILPINLQVKIDRNRQTASAQLSPGSLYYPFNNQLQKIQWQTVTAQAEFNGKGFRLNGKLITTKQQQLTINLILPEYQRLRSSPIQQQNIAGTIQIIIPNIATLANLTPALKNAQGNLQVSLALKGKIIAPQISGTAQLQNGMINISDLGLKVRAINILAQGDSTRDIMWHGSAQSGSGRIQILGKTLLNTHQPTTTLTMQGNNITAANTPQFNINASPDLNIKFSGKDLEIKGKVLLAKALFKLGDEQAQTLESSSDVVFVDSKKPTDSTTADLAIHAQVQLSLGDHARLIYNGLNSKLRGNLLITNQPGHPTTAIGQIDLVNGRYVSYGQTLIIRPNSHFMYTGNPLENPLLNIQAVREVMAIASTTSYSATSAAQTNLSAINALLNQPTKVLVGVQVQGNADHPQLTLFAQPSILSQTDILSYLLTGQPSSQLNPMNAQLLFTAANGLNLGPSKLQSVMSNLQKTTGLTKLGIESTNVVNPNTNTLEQNTSLVLGKTLTPKLYVSYSAGLLQRVNVFQITYMLNKYFSLQSTSNSFANGVDLLYTLEKN